MFWQLGDGSLNLCARSSGTIAAFRLCHPPPRPPSSLFVLGPTYLLFNQQLNPPLPVNPTPNQNGAAFEQEIAVVVAREYFRRSNHSKANHSSCSNSSRKRINERCSRCKVGPFFGRARGEKHPKFPAFGFINVKPASPCFRHAFWFFNLLLRLLFFYFMTPL